MILTLAAYIRKVDVLNRGFSGYNTDHGRVILPKILQIENTDNSRVKFMTIFLGTNDALNTVQHVPIERYRDNLVSMVKEVLRHDIKVILIGPGLHDPNLCRIERAKKGEPLEKNLTSCANNKVYSETMRSVAVKFNVPFIDLWTSFQEWGGWSEMQLINETAHLGDLLVDGVHYSPKAYEILYEKVIETICIHYPELTPENLTTKLSLWRSIDPENIEQTIFHG